MVEAILKWVVSAGVDLPEGSGGGLGMPSAAELCLATDRAGKDALTLAKEKVGDPSPSFVAARAAVPDRAVWPSFPP